MVQKTRGPEGALKEAMLLITSGAPKEQFIEKAEQARAEIISRVQEAWGDAAILDSMVPLFAPGREWTPLQTVLSTFRARRKWLPMV